MRLLDNRDNGLDILQLAYMDHTMGMVIKGQDQPFVGHQILAANKSACSYAPDCTDTLQSCSKR